MSNKFSLIEILITVTIIAVLAAMLLGGGPEVINKGKIAETKAALSKIQHGISKYESARGHLPSTDNPAIKDFKTRKLYKSLSLSEEGGPYCEVSEKMELLVGSERIYVDSWGNPFVYIPATHYENYQYPGNTGGAVKKSNGVFYNFNSYQLRSFGPNGQDNGGGGDDIQSFER